MLFNNIVLVTLALCALYAPISCGFANKCYECEDCPDPFKASDGKVKVKDCGSGNHFCLKLYEHDSEGDKIVIKTCINAKNYAEEMAQAKSKARQGRGFIELVESICDTDLCNGSPNTFSISPMQKLFIFVASLVSMLLLGSFTN